MKNYKSGTLRAKPGTLGPREARDGAKFGDFRSKLGKIWTSGRFPGTTDDDADLGTRCPRSQAAFGYSTGVLSTIIDRRNAFRAAKTPVINSTKRVLRKTRLVTLVKSSSYGLTQNF